MTLQRGEISQVEGKNILEIFEKYNAKCTSIGELDTETLRFLQEKCPELKEKINNRTILMWRNRIEHLKKHQYETTDFSVEKMVSIIPDIIKSPDYIGVNKKDSSIQFIKRLDANVLVAIRANNRSNLSFRTMYTITDSQLSDYIRKDRAWKFPLDNHDQN